MDKLKQTLYLIYSKELLNLNIGHTYNKDNLRRMVDIIGTIEYIRFNDCSRDELIKIYSRYEI